ncbi:MAG TPA: DUF493 family protein [Bdellovibrionota bacterium]|nr:DUF493 family protein [Bdellovibrionota bacterium]
MDYTKLKALLEEQERFPHDFTLKFIGLNTPAFLEDVRLLEEAYPALRQQTQRKSATEANLALTYLYLAGNADEIVALLKRVSTIRDVRVIL